MSYKYILENISPKMDGFTNQSMPLPNQIFNNAGGYYYPISDLHQLHRFLILGTCDGNYYVNNIDLTKQNVDDIKKLIENDGIKVIQYIIEISQEGRSPKNDSALFTLALAASSSNLEIRTAALNALPLVARTGTHLLMFVDFVNHLRGWGRGLKRGISNWFLNMPADKLCLQAIKYSNRHKWKLRDVLRLAHPKSKNKDHNILFDWIAHPDKKESIINAREKFSLIEGKYLIQEKKNLPEMMRDLPEIIREKGIKQISSLIYHYAVPREAIPTDLLNYPHIWEALLNKMPLLAKIRNLGKMTSIGLLKPFEPLVDQIANEIANREALEKARIHPFQLLLALRTYAKGRGELGKLKWDPISKIISALNEAFEMSFKQIHPTGKRILIGVDVSGSMQGVYCTGSPVLTCVEAAAAIAMLFVRIEEKVHTIQFDDKIYNFPISPTDGLGDIINKIRCGGATNLALPIEYALSNKLEVDAFIIITDNETWIGNQHPVQALNHYRNVLNKDAKLIVLATSANKGCITDPADPLSLGISGFDSSAPQIVTEFIKGSF